MPLKEECIFYHSMDLPDGEIILGPWDIREPGFKQYVGNYQLEGKTVLDVGTASGFLAFGAEQSGASHVTALEVFSSEEIRHLQFAGYPFHANRRQWDRDADTFFFGLKRSFWYAWHKLNSHVEVIYTPIDSLPYWMKQFDVVIAGAIIEHLSDPVTAIGNIARLAKEAIIIAFTPIEDTDDQIMRSANAWDNPVDCFTWWILSRGLYQRIFDNLGFDLEFSESIAYRRFPEPGLCCARPTIIARRRSSR